jgi:ABC-type bacteriocin/lantibiotic exporter with double-glycine peptidase domain
LTASPGRGRAGQALALFDLIREPMLSLPDMLSRGLESWESLDRIAKFLSSAELDQPTGPGALAEVAGLAPGLAVSVEAGQFGVGTFRLADLSLSIPVGALVAVVGEVGCGKTTLLHSVLGETDCHGPPMAVARAGGLSYAAQTPFVMNATVVSHGRYCH